ncbi:myeloid-associated differentiation marker homolog isoform X2 [Alligator mississippiensis]|uniref:myeloid-associated differentiation marker homolog isoform X2 n=1 Tax=Alligator mississippiensis TaxID=8496 RepID=UPI002877EF3F|nr:myeloid-associated differentiation marker homolog isoform X2 [Alligator mississippiensis]
MAPGEADGTYETLQLGDGSVDGTYETLQRGEGAARHGTQQCRGEPAMPVQHSSLVGNTKALTRPMGIMHLLEALFTCIAFSVVASNRGWWQANITWCMFSWCFCFSVTPVVLLVETVGLQHRIPVSWKDFRFTFTMYASLFTLSASVTYPFTEVRNELYCVEQDYRIAATFFSCLACMTYSVEVTMIHTTPGEVTGFMATMPGMLKVVETFIACIIFFFIFNTMFHDWHGALKWCLAVYCICFILSLVVIVLCISKCINWMSCASIKILSGYTLLAVLLYISATILWALYNFESNHRQPIWARDYWDHTFCTWDKPIAITVLTSINLVVYITDLVCSAHLIFRQA